MPKKKPQSLSRAQAERWHAKLRCLERYGFWINRDLYKSIIYAIQQRSASPCANLPKDILDAELLERQSNMLSRWSITLQHKGKKHTLIVIYDKKRRELRTTLPRENEPTIHSH